MRATGWKTKASFLAAVLFALAGCRSSGSSTPASNEAEPGRRSGVDLQILVGPFERTREKIESDKKVDYAFLDVRNDLDRSISVDFVGGNHYDLSVGDSRTERIRLAAGSYSMAVSAAGLKPAKQRFSVSAGRVYEVVVFQRRARD